MSIRSSRRRCLCGGLLDGTAAENAPLIERNIEAVGVPLHAVKQLISDHAHHDHVGALAQIKQDTGAEFLASAADTWALEHGRVRGDTNYRKPKRARAPQCRSHTFFLSRTPAEGYLLSREML